jgi:Flp pilus assembly protein TadG
MLFVALVLTVLLGFLGFVLNAGHATSVRGELQNASDAAALAAARELNGQASGIAAARNVAAAFSTHHDTDTTRAVNIDSTADVRFCNWNPAAHAIHWCLPYGADPSTAPPPIPTLGATTQLEATNAVQVKNGREASRENALPVWLSAFLGNVTTMDARSSATAIGGGPASLPPGMGCLPFAYVDCALANGCNMPVVYRNNNSDTAGFTLLDTGNVSANGINQFLQANLCPGVYGQSISMNNGNISAAPVWNQLKALVGGQYPIPIVHSDTCKINASQLYPIVGFATLLITGVYRNAPDNPPPACGGVTPCITATVTCDQTTNGPPGGINFGLPTLRTQLVQ